jgi:prepilin-type N-terminal cleavage/methylation domain-containing protein
MNKNNYNNKGSIVNQHAFSLIEMLVVISIFAAIGILSIQAVSLTLKSSRKSESLVRVRENVNYSLAVIERQLRNSESITSTCTGTPSTSLSYTTTEGTVSSFTCITPGTSGYIASGSARLTSTDISVTACSFTCTQTDASKPPVVKLSVTAEDSLVTGAEKGSASTDLEIVTRNY